MIITCKNRIGYSLFALDNNYYLSRKAIKTISKNYPFLKRKKISMLRYNMLVNDTILFEERFIKARERQEKAMIKLFGKRTVEEVKDIYITKISQETLHGNHIRNISFVELPITFINTIETYKQVALDYPFDLIFINSEIRNLLLDKLYDSTISDSDSLESDRLNKIIENYKQYSCARIFFKRLQNERDSMLSTRFLSPPGYSLEEGSPINEIGYNQYAPNSRALLEDNYSYVVLLLTPRTRVRNPISFNDGIISSYIKVKISLTDFERYFNMFGLLLSNVIEYYVTVEDIGNSRIRDTAVSKMAQHILDILPELNGHQKFRKIQSLIADMNPVAMGSLRQNTIERFSY